METLSPWVPRGKKTGNPRGKALWAPGNKPRVFGCPPVGAVANRWPEKEGKEIPGLKPKGEN